MQAGLSLQNNRLYSVFQTEKWGKCRYLFYFYGTTQFKLK